VSKNYDSNITFKKFREDVLKYKEVKSPIIELKKRKINMANKMRMRECGEFWSVMETQVQQVMESKKVALKNIPTDLVDKKF
jgi:hypothetical protein